MKQKYTAQMFRDLIGKRIVYKTHGLLTEMIGTVEQVRGKNVMVDGDWYWFGCRACEIEVVRVVEG